MLAIKSKIRRKEKREGRAFKDKYKRAISVKHK
jgi:hypothetical protein